MRSRSLGLLMAGAAVAFTILSCQTMRPALPSGRPVPPTEHEEAYDRPPVPTTRVPARYPEFAREAQITGTVVVRVKVGKDGRLDYAGVTQGVVGLTDAAVLASRRWLFQPATKAGAPVRAWYEIEFVFPP